MRLTRILRLIPAATLVAFANTGSANAVPDCGAAGQDTKTPPKAAESPTAKSTATGIPECDKYFTMVEACIATKKMSPEDQKAAQSTVDRLRTMLPIARAPQGRAELAKRCTASLQAGQKDDKYGCYQAK